jgi:hypothetical protein
LEPEVSDVVEVAMGKEGREHRAWRRTDLSDLHEPIFHDTSLYHPADEAYDAFIADPLPEQLAQPRMMHRVDAAAYVSLYEDVDPLLLEGAPQCVTTLVRATLGTVAGATVVEQRLKKWCKHPLGGEFHDRIFKAAAAQRSSLLTARLRHVYPALGVRAVAHPCEAR